ncbi:CGNR zinc finger domain-containing protein [Phenylobacterium sp.]|uniref:CGNR zinc finger domain-containing protein n=1 Tax=Phenylobacterium sp. TaxID=1871053 RepID=UPI002E373A9D|nr:ABATE domain-containing protein [Phenylobacterium sp.]HEX4711246.1 ABATE domain-containing protein [Phenylobacterium sp.]
MTPPHLAEERDGFRFRGGHNAIDLPATLQARLKPTPRELLKTPQDLVRWLAAAGLASSPLEANESDLTLARSLREAIYALANAKLPGGPDPADALTVLNAVAAEPSATPQLTADGEVRLVGPVSALLATLARDAVRMFGGEAADHIRQCQSPTCTLFFIDTSRSGERRWCSMSGCGNTAKVAEFRRRRREAKSGA